MKGTLFYPIIAKNTGVIIHIFVFPSKQVPYVESIPEEQPEEKLMFTKIA